jgi:hypothetical protein
MTRKMPATSAANSCKLERYREALEKIPPPGCGCHTSLLGVANQGVIAGIDLQKIFDDIRVNIPEGSRRISDREIVDAVNKAMADHNGGIFTPRPRPVSIVKDGASALQRIIGLGDISDESDLWECSPIRLLDEPKDDPALLLKTLFDESDYVFVGERYQPGIIGDTIRMVEQWKNYFQNGGKTAPHIIVNPLTGLPAPKESGEGETHRGNGNVAEYRYCIIEFDNLSRGDQIRFWTTIKLPIVALIDSGGKSIHGWIDVHKMAQIATPEQWKTEIESRLYDRILAPLGVDKACANSARLSRLPGHFREEKGQYQRLLWLSPEGRPVCQ